MKRVRNGVFETNSSMSHACIIMTEKENDLWSSGEYYYFEGDWELEKLPNPPIKGRLYTKEEALNYCKQSKYYDESSFANESDESDDDNDVSNFDRRLGFWGFTSYNLFNYDEYMEFDDVEYTTPGGEKIIVNCKYGHD